MERIDNLKRLISEYPNDCFSRHALAMEYLKLGNTEAAVEEMENLLLIDRNHIGTYYHLAKAYEKLAQYPHALEVLENGIKLASSISSENDLREMRAALQQLRDEMDEN